MRSKRHIVIYIFAILILGSAAVGIVQGVRESSSGYGTFLKGVGDLAYALLAAYPIPSLLVLSVPAFFVFRRIVRSRSGKRKQEQL